MLSSRLDLPTLDKLRIQRVSEEMFSQADSEIFSSALPKQLS